MKKNKKTKTAQVSQSIQLEKLLDMRFNARLILGSCTMEIGDILGLGQGAILELDTPTHEPLELWVNDRMIAKAETVVVNERFGARITEISPTAERLKDMASNQ